MRIHRNIGVEDDPSGSHKVAIQTDVSSLHYHTNFHAVTINLQYLDMATFTMNANSCRIPSTRRGCGGPCPSCLWRAARPRSTTTSPSWISRGPTAPSRTASPRSSPWTWVRCHVEQNSIQLIQYSSAKQQNSAHFLMVWPLCFDVKSKWPNHQKMC